MTNENASSGPILRLFQVHTKHGRAKELMSKFETVSADVVLGHPGNLGYFFGEGTTPDEDYVVFASVWRDLDAVKNRFGEDWQSSHLPPGYQDLIEECSVKHLNIGGGWRIDMQSG